MSVLVRIRVEYYVVGQLRSPQRQHTAAARACTGMSYVQHVTQQSSPHTRASCKADRRSCKADRTSYKADKIAQQTYPVAFQLHDLDLLRVPPHSMRDGSARICSCGEEVTMLVFGNGQEQRNTGGQMSTPDPVKMGDFGKRWKLGRWEVLD